MTLKIVIVDSSVQNEVYNLEIWQCTPLQSPPLHVLNQRGSRVLVAQGSVSTNRGKQAHQRFIWDDQSGSTDLETSPLSVQASNSFH